MISEILTTTINVVIAIVNVIMIPINALITTLLPSSLLTGFDYITDFLDLSFSSISWAISLTGISTTALNFITIYFTIKLTAPMLVFALKRALKWYDAVKN